MPIDTLADVKLMLGVVGDDDDGLLDVLRAAADEFILAHCGRNFCGGEFTEDHPAGIRTVFLRNFPVAEVLAVRVDERREFGPGTELDPSRYVVHADNGVIEHLRGPFLKHWTGDAPGMARVTYTVATGAVPAAVRRAYAELIGHWYRQAKTAAALGQKNVLTECDTETGMEKKYPWGQSGGFRVPAGVADLLAPYRVPAV